MTATEVPPLTPLASKQLRRVNITRPAYWTYVLALCLISIQIATWMIGVGYRGGLNVYARVSTDHLAVLTGAQIIRDGAGQYLYDLETQREAQRRILGPALAVTDDSILVFVHPPFEAIFLAPLLSLPYGVTYALSVVLALIAFGLALGILQRSLPIVPAAKWPLIITLCSTVPLHRTLWMAQTSALVFLGLWGTYAALRRRQEYVVGLWLTLIVLKPQLLPCVVLLLLLLRHWRTLLTAGGVLGGCYLSTLPLLGFTWPLRYVVMIIEESRWGAERGEQPEIMHVWRGLTTNLFGKDLPGLVVPVSVVLMFGSLILLVWAWWGTYTQNRTSTADLNHTIQRDLLWSLTCITAVLLPNHLYLHDLLLLLLPAWLLATHAVNGSWPTTTARLWLGLLWANHLVLFFTLFSNGIPGIAVIPSVVLLATVAILLATWTSSRKVQLITTR